MVSVSGKSIETEKEALDRRIREEERAEGTEAVAISFDGVNVLLSERGTRKGRKAQRPKVEDTTSEITAYRHAMVSSIFYYGQEESNPGVYKVSMRPECLRQGS